MSHWSSWKENQGLFGATTEEGFVLGEGEEQTAMCSYVVHIPPPMCGPSRPSSALEVVSITWGHVSMAPDARGKMVTWYELVVNTPTHQWQVLKRFSEFLDLYRKIDKVGFLKLAQRRLQKGIVSPPSRLSPQQWRKMHLERFLNSLLQSLKDISITVVTGAGDDSEALQTTVLGVLRGAFSDLIHFLTRTSYDGLLETANEENTTKTSLTHESSPRCLATGDQGYVPPSKIVHISERLFMIMLQLPGASLTSVYVDSTASAALHTTSSASQGIIVGGSWNGNIMGLSSVITDVTDTCQSSGGSLCDGENSCGLVEDDSSLQVLFDTFPVGEFQMKFEVPSTFAIDEWQSDYAAGILFLTWRREE